MSIPYQQISVGVKAAVVSPNNRMYKNAIIMITTKCNNKCTWCYSKSVLNNGSNMSMNTFKTIVSILKNNGVQTIILTGGEPTTHPALIPFIEQAILSNIKQINVISNGANLTKDILNRLIDYKDYLKFNFSLHGANKETHDSITNIIGSYDKLTKSIKLCQDMGFKLGIQTTLCRTNMIELYDLLLYVESMNINGFLINFCNKPINATFNVSDFLSIYEFSECIANVLNIIHSNLDIQVGPPLPICKLAPSFIKLLNRQEVRIKTGCGIFNNQIIIDMSGNILLCPNLPNLYIGNIYNIEIEKSLDIIDSMYKKPLRAFPSSKCNNCQYVSVCCMGGCILLRLDKTENII